MSNRKKWTIGLIIAALLALPIGGYLGYRAWLGGLQRKWLQRFEADLRSPKRFRLPAGGPSQGPARAPVTVVLFTDLQCVACARLERSLGELVRQNPGRIRLIHRSFPLDGSCNPLLRGRRFHRHACLASRLLACAGRQGKLWAYRAALFSRARDLQPKLMLSLARQSGLELKRLEACGSSKWARHAVDADLKAGMALGVASTPVLFFNGHRIRGSWSTKLLQRVLDRAVGAGSGANRRSRAAGDGGPGDG